MEQGLASWCYGAEFLLSYFVNTIYRGVECVNVHYHYQLFMTDIASKLLNAEGQRNLICH